MSMPGMDWAWTATGALSAVAASSVLIIVSSDWFDARVRRRTRGHARARSGVAADR
jgi:hypothetical protein